MEKHELLTSKKPILLTHALIYANGDMHIGHMVESIQTDVFARAMRMLDKEVLFVGASDMHGTPIEINSKKQGKKPEEFANYFHKKDQEVYKKYGMSFDHYYNTHSKSVPKVDIHHPG